METFSALELLVIPRHTCKPRVGQTTSNSWGRKLMLALTSSSRNCFSKTKFSTSGWLTVALLASTAWLFQASCPFSATTDSSECLNSQRLWSQMKSLQPWSPFKLTMNKCSSMASTSRLSRPKTWWPMVSASFTTTQWTLKHLYWWSLMATLVLTNHASFLSQSPQEKTEVQKKCGLSSGKTSRKVTFLKQANGTTSQMVVGAVPFRQLLKPKKRDSSRFPRKFNLWNFKRNKNCGVAQWQAWQTSAVYFASISPVKLKSSPSLKVPCSWNLMWSDKFFLRWTRTNSSQLIPSPQWTV